MSLWAVENAQRANAKSLRQGYVSFVLCELERYCPHAGAHACPNVCQILRAKYIDLHGRSHLQSVNKRPERAAHGRILRKDSTRQSSMRCNLTASVAFQVGQEQPVLFAWSSLPRDADAQFAKAASRPASRSGSFVGGERSYVVLASFDN